MSLETAAIEALNLALTKVHKIPRPEWKKEIWKELKEFCEKQLGEKNMSQYLLRAEKESSHKLHDQYEFAEAEAKRLCGKENQRIFIWKCIGEVKSKEAPIEVVIYEGEK